MVMHEFGGSWTEQKLSALRDYLIAYRQIFSKNPRAAKLKTIYVDAFAGTGSRVDRGTHSNDAQMSLVDLEEAESIRAGSARIALELPSPFDEYLFIDKKRAHARHLQELIDTQFAHLSNRCSVSRGDANEVLRNFAQSQNWNATRAVVFLDPYGMSVDWETLTALARTQAIDLWLLIPVGNAVMRLLERKSLPRATFSRRLTLFFGEDAWRDRFYKIADQGQLFGESPQEVKIATFESIGQYSLERLATIFAGVAPRSLPLVNSKGNVLFLLCFAAANKKGAPIAIRIANHLL